MARSEKAIMNEALVKASALPDTLVYRQNTGTAWQGRIIHVPAGQYIRVEYGMKVIADARPVSFGLEGAGDIVGVSKGKPIQAEIKTEIGQQREVQMHFERAWVKAGGVYILARSADELVNKISTLY